MRSLIVSLFWFAVAGYLHMNAHNEWVVLLFAAIAFSMFVKFFDSLKKKD